MAGAKRAERVETVFETEWFSFEAVSDEGSTEKPYYRISSNDSVGVLALTPDRKILLVRQYRAAVGESVLEYPGGQLEKGETPDDAVRREFGEETGYTCESFVHIGSFRVASYRINSTVHAFFGAGAARMEGSVKEPQIELEFVSLDEFDDLILSGELKSLPELGVYYVARLKGLI